jgi:hypothetical protein
MPKTLATFFTALMDGKWVYKCLDIYEFKFLILTWSKHKHLNTQTPKHFKYIFLQFFVTLLITSSI